MDRIYNLSRCPIRIGDNMKFSKRQKQWAFIIFLIGIAVYIGFFRGLSLISIPGLETQSHNIMWQEFTINLESVYFGSISNTNTLEFQAIKEGFCGGNDADVTLTNSYSSGASLSLSSAMSSGHPCGGDNYIKANLILPPGELTINFNGNAKSTNPDVVQVLFQ